MLKQWPQQKLRGCPFRIRGSGFSFQGLGFRIQGFGAGVQGLGAPVWRSLSKGLCCAGVEIGDSLCLVKLPYGVLSAGLRVR